MIGDDDWFEKLPPLDDLAMRYEVAVIPLFEADYLREFRRFYELSSGGATLVASKDGFEEALAGVCGEGRWEAIAEKTLELYGRPTRVTVFDDDQALRRELEGPDGLAPFFFVFGLMFCEFEGFCLCFMSGTNN